MKGNFNYLNDISVPEGLPQRRGRPLYPDPSIYPPEVMKGYRDWPILVATPTGLSWNATDPNSEEARHLATLRNDDSLELIKRLLGPPTSEEYHAQQKLSLLHYSPDVKIAVQDRFLYAIYLSEKDGGDHFGTWRFVFVAPGCIDAPRLDSPAEEATGR